MKKIFFFCLFCFFALVTTLAARNIDSTWVISVETTMDYHVKNNTSLPQITPEERATFNKFLTVMFKDIEITINTNKQVITITGPKVQKEYSFTVQEQTEDITILVANNGTITLTLNETKNTLSFANSQKQTESFIFTRK